MSIPAELRTLINQLNQELTQTEQQATEGLNRARKLLSQFSDNAQTIQFFAYFNTVLMFIENSRRRTQVILAGIATDEVSVKEIQEAGEDLGTLLGQAIETKIEVRRILSRLQRYEGPDRKELAELVEMAGIAAEKARVMYETADAIAKKWEDRLADRQMAREKQESLSEES